MNNSPILLCGFMGAGKTTVGQALASRLGLPLLDTDAMIEAQHGPIPQIFAQQGESAFRQMELQLAQTLPSAGQAVISTGGGFLLTPAVRQCLTGNCRVIYLSVPFQECYRRIAASDRPLVRQNTKEQLSQLYARRDGIYRETATWVVDNSDSLENTIGQIISLLG